MVEIKLGRKEEEFEISCRSVIVAASQATLFDLDEKTRKQFKKKAKSKTCKDPDAKIGITCKQAAKAQRALKKRAGGILGRAGKFPLEKAALDEFTEFDNSLECLRVREEI